LIGNGGLRVLERGFRPFFLLASLVPALSLSVWLAVLGGADVRLAALTPRDWHVHELLFGFFPGVVAGFLLTAVPNWTGRPPICGRALAALVLLWVAGRGAMLLPGFAGLWPAAVALAFPVGLAVVVWHEVLAGGSRRNLPVCLLVALLAVADVGFVSSRLWGFDAGGIFERLGLAVAATLVALIGGRVVPAFTRNWMRQHALTPLPAAFSAADRIALVLLLAALGAWLWAPAAAATAVLFALAAVANAVRLSRWRAPATVSEPLLLILHLGYGWLVLWLALGAAASAGMLPASVAVHTLTTGVVGTMTLAIMTRASLGHAGRPLSAGGATVAAYVMVQAGALLRLLTPLLPLQHFAVLCAAAALWAGAFALFALSYGALLIGLEGRTGRGT
jgi:uncharacterized protein involved in response to NO